MLRTYSGHTIIKNKKNKELNVSRVCAQQVLCSRISVPSVNDSRIIFTLRPNPGLFFLSFIIIDGPLSRDKNKKGTSVAHQLIKDKRKGNCGWARMHVVPVHWCAPLTAVSWSENCAAAMTLWSMLIACQHSLWLISPFRRGARARRNDFRRVTVSFLFSLFLMASEGKQGISWPSVTKSKKKRKRLNLFHLVPDQR